MKVFKIIGIIAYVVALIGLSIVGGVSSYCDDGLAHHDFVEAVLSTGMVFAVVWLMWVIVVVSYFSLQFFLEDRG